MRNPLSWARDAFGKQGRKEIPRKGAKDFLAEADAQVNRGEYGVAISLLRRAMKTVKPEDAIDFEKETRRIWNAIQSHAVRNMGDSSHTGVEMTDEFVATAPKGKRGEGFELGLNEWMAGTQGAMDNLRMVKEASNIGHDIAWGLTPPTDEQLERLQRALEKREVPKK
jgi:hypothetical protein